MLDVNFFIKRLNLSKKETFLLKLYTSNTVTKDEVYSLLYDFDYSIEKETLPFNFLLAQLFQNNPYIEIPKNIEPRLKGVLRLFQYYNVSLLLSVKQLVAELNKNDIPVMFIKNSSMKVFDADKTRMMYVADCAVPKEQFSKTIEISKKLGFKINGKYGNVTEILKNDNQRIAVYHTLINSNKNVDKVYEDIFKRAIKHEFHGLHILIANIEDFLFLLFNNGYNDIIYSQTFYKKISWLLDSFYIIKNNKNINWENVIRKAKETGSLAQIKIMLELFEYFLPNTIPHDLISSIQISKREQKDFNLYTKNHLCFYRAQEIIKEIRIKEKSDFFGKTKLFAQFLYLKIIQRVPIINTLFFEKMANKMFEC